MDIQWIFNEIQRIFNDTQWTFNDIRWIFNDILKLVKPDVIAPAITSQPMPTAAASQLKHSSSFCSKPSLRPCSDPSVAEHARY